MSEELAAKLRGNVKPSPNDPERVHPSDNTHPARVAATLYAREHRNCELEQWAGQAMADPVPGSAPPHCEMYWADTIAEDDRTVLIIACKLGAMGWFCVDLEMEPLSEEGELPGSVALELPKLAWVAARLGASATNAAVDHVVAAMAEDAAPDDADKESASG